MAKKPRTVTNARVKLRTRHYINGVMEPKGKVITGYTGPVSSDMEVLSEGGAKTGDTDPNNTGGTDPNATGAGTQQ